MPVPKTAQMVIMKPRISPSKVIQEVVVVVWKPENGGKIQTQSMIAEVYGKYKVIGNQAMWSVTFEKPILANEISIKLNLGGNIITKHLSKHFISLTSILKNGELYESTSTKALVRMNSQTITLFLEGQKEVKMIKIDIGRNIGFAWWMIPHTLEIEEIKFLN